MTEEDFESVKEGDEVWLISLGYIPIPKRGAVIEKDSYSVDIEITDSRENLNVAYTKVHKTKSDAITYQIAMCANYIICLNEEREKEIE